MSSVIKRHEAVRKPGLVKLHLGKIEQRCRTSPTLKTDTERIPHEKVVTKYPNSETYPIF